MTRVDVVGQTARRQAVRIDGRAVPWRPSSSSSFNLSREQCDTRNAENRQESQSYVNIALIVIQTKNNNYSYDWRHAVGSLSQISSVKGALNCTTVTPLSHWKFIAKIAYRFLGAFTAAIAPCFVKIQFSLKSQYAETFSAIDFWTNIVTGNKTDTSVNENAEFLAAPGPKHYGVELHFRHSMQPAILVCCC